MANRRTSALLQIATAAVLAGTWALAKAWRRPRKADGSGYDILPRRYIPLSLVLLAADLYAIPAILRGKLLIDTGEFEGIHRESVSWIDRAALSYVGEHAERYRLISDRVLQGIIVLPALLFADARIRKDWRDVLTLYLWLHALTYTIYSFSPLGPAFVDKYRPIVYYTDLPEALRNVGNNRNARFSGHTAAGACAGIFMAKAYNDYHPGLPGPEKLGLYLLAGLPPMLLGWLRTKALKHFPGDVLLAMLIGGACGVALPDLYKE